MKWFWVSRRKHEITVKGFFASESRVCELSMERDGLRTDKEGLQKEVLLWIAKTQELASKHDADVGKIHALENSVQSLSFERDEWQKTAEDFKKKLDAQPKPGFNPRAPRFHGPNGIAAQLEAAAREDQKGNQ